MKATRTIATAMLLLGATMTSHVAPAQWPGIGRSDLMRQDLSAPGREVVQALVEFAPGASASRHLHPGEELVYVTAGELEYRLDGKPAVTLKAGQVLFIPSGTVHAVTNVGRGKALELATYIVQKGQPLLATAE